MKTTRKIQSIGNKSYSISLPKTWVKENGLREKETLSMETNGSKLILTKSHNEKEKSSETFKIDEIESLGEFILLAYVKGVNEFELIGPNSGKKHEIYQKLRYADGFKIITEDKNRILIKYIYDQAQVNINEILKRCLNIINQMIECLEKKDTKTLDYLEDSLDSLYYVSRRILYHTFFDSNAMEKNGVLDIEDISSYKNIFKKLEQIGDALCRSKGKKGEKLKNAAEIIDVLNNVFIIHKKPNEEDILKLKKIQTESDSEKRIKDLCYDIIENKITIDLNKKFFG